MHNLAASMPDKLRELNDTYAKLVYNRRNATALNFTSDNGWKCTRNTCSALQCAFARMCLPRTRTNDSQAKRCE